MAEIDEDNTLLGHYLFSGWLVVNYFGCKDRYCALKRNGMFLILDVIKNCIALNEAKA